MTKLCPRGKAAAKRKFRVYPSAYANAYASKICAGKIKDPSGVKRKDFKGRKGAAMGGSMNPEIIKKLKQKMMGTGATKRTFKKLKDKLAEIRRDSAKVKKENLKANPFKEGLPKEINKSKLLPKRRDMTGPRDPRREGRPSRPKDIPPRVKKAGGGLMEATERLKRQGLKTGEIVRPGVKKIRDKVKKLTDKLDAQKRDRAKVKNTPNKSSKKSGSSILDVFKSYGKYDGKPIELKSGGRACKLAMKGKGRAYGKNS